MFQLLRCFHGPNVMYSSIVLRLLNTNVHAQNDFSYNLRPFTAVYGSRFPSTTSWIARKYQINKKKIKWKKGEMIGMYEFVIEQIRIIICICVSFGFYLCVSVATRRKGARGRSFV